MATFYLVRHGEANYSDVASMGFYGFGRDFAPYIEKMRPAEIVETVYVRGQADCAYSFY